MRRQTAGLTILVLLLATLSVAQTAPAPGGTGVPPVLRFSGTLAVPPGRIPVTFGLYADQTGGEPLWQETQTVTVDATGRYAVVLGAATALPVEVFVSGEARWLDVAVGGLAPQPRALLVSVPYALKAADAETIGGKPLSAFVLAGEKTGTAADGLTYLNPRALTTATKPLASGAGVLPQGAGSAGYLGVFTDSVNLGNSVIFQSGTSIGIGTTTPAASFHVAGTSAPAAFFDVYSNALTALPVVYRAARGTPAAPAAVQTDDILGGLAVRGYAPAGFTGGQGQVMFKAAENWSNTGHGTYLQFTTTPVGAADWVERMRISPDGYVGIGASTPQFPLDVRLPNKNTYASFGADTTGGLFLIANSPQIGFNLSYPSSTSNWTRNAAGPAGYLAFGQEATGMFSFATLPSGAAGTTGIPIPRMVISNTGNVGIGTTSPAYPLDVTGNTNVVGAVTVTGYVNSTSLSGSWFTSTANDGTGLSGYANSGSNAWGVYGSSTSGVGVYGSGALYGVKANSTSGTGILATNGASTNATGQFENSSPAGMAIVARVNATTVMNVDAAGVHAGPGMTGTPIAYGSFSSAGSKLSGSDNLSCVWNATSTRYDCTISGASYNPSAYTTLVTAANSSLPLFCTTSWDGGSLLIVRVFDQTFTSVQRQFHLVVFKP